MIRLRTLPLSGAGTLLLCLLLIAFPMSGVAAERFSMSANDMPVNDVMAMFSKKGRVSIMLEKGVSGDVSFSLYEVTLDEAIQAVAEMAGFVAERRGKTYYIVDKKNVGSHAAGGLTQLRVFPIRYANPQSVLEVVKSHISRYGKVTLSAQEGAIVVEDKPDFLSRIATLLSSLDAEPRQILIEARILEVTLSDTLAHGINWTKLFSVDPGEVKQIGVQGLAAPGAPGLFATIVNDNIDLLLDALETDGRLRTISTPKLLALENKEASVVVGDRIGYRVTTTINQVTTESIEFLESGVILRVTPSISVNGRVMLDIYPQISTGSVNNGIPSKTTTEVVTNLITNDQQTVFIGGLLKNSMTESRSGVPFLKDIPLIGRLFSSSETTSSRTETVVLITPYIVRSDGDSSGQYIRTLDSEEAEVLDHIRSQRYGKPASERKAQSETAASETKTSPSKPAGPPMMGPRR